MRSFLVTRIKEITAVPNPALMPPVPVPKRSWLVWVGVLVVLGGVTTYVVFMSREFLRPEFTKQPRESASLWTRLTGSENQTAPPTESEGALAGGSNVVRAATTGEVIRVDDPNPPRDLQQNNSLAYYKRALERLQLNDLDGAILDFTRSLVLDPSFTEGYLARARAWVSRVEANKAIDDCNRAIEMKPLNAQAYYIRGIARQAKGDTTVAVADFSKAIELSPNFAAAFNGRAWMLALQGELGRALQDATKAVRLSPRSAEVYDTRGWIRFMNGDLAEAKVDCEHAVKLEPRSAAAHASRGLLHYMAQEYDQAVTEWTQAIKLVPPLKTDLGPWIDKARQSQPK